MWMESERLKKIADGILSAADASRKAQSCAYAHIDVDAITRTIIIRTGNSIFGGCDEIRRGRIGDWILIWERSDIWVTTGEDYLTSELRTWLLEHTR